MMIKSAAEMILVIMYLIKARNARSYNNLPVTYSYLKQNCDNINFQEKYSRSITFLELYVYLQVISAIVPNNVRLIECFVLSAHLCMDLYAWISGVPRET